ELINHEQSAFIEGRQILDGPLILNEIVSLCKSRKEQALLFKVDFQKAFDSVRWDHLDDILGKFGFGSKWRWWIRGCLHSSKASVLVNGFPTNEFLFHRVGKMIWFISVHILHLFYANDAMSIVIAQKQYGGLGVSGLASSKLFTVLMALLISLPRHVPVGLFGSRFINQSLVLNLRVWIFWGSARKLFNLDLQKDVSVAQKFQNQDFAVSFRRRPRGGIGR
ncbi:cysteine-rich receptor-like protein kinase, partial [Tanacetum coccineum]